MITRRNFLAGIAASVAAGNVQAQEAKTALKKGWCGGKVEHHERFNVGWYYNWGPSGGSDAAEFVPLIKRKKDLSKWALNKIRSYDDVTHLLGFNEPEREKQSNMTVKEAISYWPQLMDIAAEKNLKLGSPAVSGDKGGMDWIREFMDQADKKDLKVDFFAVHWYGGTDADKLEGFLDGYEKKYRLPIWLTEFNAWSGTESENYSFLKKSLRFLERSRNIERYAYFNFKAGRAQALMNADGTLTRMGEAYRDAGT